MVALCSLLTTACTELAARSQGSGDQAERPQWVREATFAGCVPTGETRREILWAFGRRPALRESEVADAPTLEPIMLNDAPRLMCRQWRGFSIWLSYSTPGAAGSSAGQWQINCAPNWYWTRWRWRLANGGPKTSSTTATRAANTSVAFGKRCGEAGVRPSISSVGDAYDNAMAESFFSSLEAELLSRRRFASRAEAKMACFSYIEGW